MEIWNVSEGMEYLILQTMEPQDMVSMGLSENMTLW